MSSVFRCAILLTGVAVMASCASSASKSAPPQTTATPITGPLPFKFSGGPTKPEILSGDLMTRLYKYADDSMMGRRAGTEGNVKATAYIAAEFRRLGLQPAGDSGGYLQDIHYGNKTPSYNVVAILPGSDPVLRHQYVAIGAHNDHNGISSIPVFSSDSLRAVKLIRKSQRVQRLIPPGLTGKQRSEKVSQLEAEALRALLDTIRLQHPTPRRDSVMNGADDDGSGTVVLLELAEALVNAPVKPKRSILFVSHTAEELGLVGSAFYTNAPTVPLDSIVANINIDMIGRGTIDDLPQGGPRYLALVGSRRLSTEFGDLVDSVNAKQANPFKLDYQYDYPGDPQKIYYRSDHWNYAKRGIPVVFFFTGLHLDYHQLTDEPQYIDYDKMARATKLIYDIIMETGNLPKRPFVDKPMKPGASSQ